MSQVSTETVFVVRLSKKEADIVASALLHMSWSEDQFPEAESLRDSLLDSGADHIDTRVDSSVDEIIRA